MENEKVKIILARLMERIDMGEWENQLTIPFASKKLLKSIVRTKMNKKIETGGNPMFTDMDMLSCVNETKETALIIAALFIKNGILGQTDNGIVLGEMSKTLFKQ